jgi:hypothetical protein
MDLIQSIKNRHCDVSIVSFAAKIVQVRCKLARSSRNFTLSPKLPKDNSQSSIGIFQQCRDIGGYYLGEIAGF